MHCVHSGNRGDRREGGQVLALPQRRDLWVAPQYVASFVLSPPCLSSLLPVGFPAHPTEGIARS